MRTPTEIREQAAKYREEGGLINMQLALVLQWTLHGEPPADKRLRQIPVHARVQADGRSTSWDAALSITRESTARQYKAIYEILSQSPRTDYELRDRMEQLDIPHSESGVRARRAELEDQGWVEDTGETRPTPSGRQAKVWRAVR